MRVTKLKLHSAVDMLNRLLDRPTVMFSENSKMNVGHLTLDKSDTGFQLEEIITEGGAVTAWSGRMNGTEMALYLDGISKGISLRNAHIRASADRGNGRELYSK